MIKDINIFSKSIQFLFMTALLYSQNGQLEFLSLESKQNGILVHLRLNQTIEMETVTAWQANSGWFYLTLYQITGDSSKLMPSVIPLDIIEFQIIVEDESTQLGLRLKEPIEHYDFSQDKTTNTMVAALHYSSEYLARLESIQHLEKANPNRGMSSKLKPWLYFTGGGLIITGLVAEDDNMLNAQTQTGLGILFTTLVMDLIWNRL